MHYIKFYTEISMHDASLVGPKNASLGQMIQHLEEAGIEIPHGFAITVDAYKQHLEKNGLYTQLNTLLNSFDYTNITQLQVTGKQLRDLIVSAPLPQDIVEEIAKAYTTLSNNYHTQNLDVAVRSSATAEDLPGASFAGQLDTFLNIKGIDEVLEAVKKCMASVFTDRALVYRSERNFDHFSVGVSVGIQKMVRSDLASSGVAFSLDTDTGFKESVVITSAYGLGENIVKGIVNPDEFHVHKTTLLQGFRPIIKKFLGSKEYKLIYQGTTTQNIEVSKNEQEKFSLQDDEILTLARNVITIEQHYSEMQGSWCPMDVEWAKDGIDKKIYIVQARPETVYSQKKEKDVLISYHLKKNSSNLPVIATGLSIGQKIAYGPARILKNIDEYAQFQEGDLLVTSMTDPDWVPLMKKASAIVTDKGGRTCHAAIVSRELGIPAIIGTGNATSALKEGNVYTVDCSEGAVGTIYEGALEYTISETELGQVPRPRVPLLINIGDPDRAYRHSFLPVSGVGLARLEFIITNAIKIHPMAVCSPGTLHDQEIKRIIEQRASAYENPLVFYRDTLAQGIGMLAAAFYPREIIVRLSDFKSNEYRNLLGGKYFEPVEENPMIGFRGAVRYCDPAYAPAFALECEAIKKARNEMGFTNIKIMVPFVRNLYEAGCSVAALQQHGLVRGQNGLKILMMCEIPSNVILLEEFSKYFDGFSIGSNDLTQLTLAVDRDSELLSQQFNERDPAVMKMFKLALEAAKKTNSYISICGEAPSNYPEIADFLIDNGIDALSLNPDSVISFLMNEKIK